VIVRKMTASFGVLQNRTLELSPGLNIIEAPNEYGKTTWCAFLRAMLYGIDTAQRGRAGGEAAAPAALTRADTQIAIASFSNENVAGEAKRLASLCNANIKEKSITASVSNDAVLEEMARRPNMYGRLVIPSVGVNVALFAVVSQAAADAQDSAAYFPFKNYMLVADHWNQGFWKIKRCSVGTKAYIYRGTSIQTLTCTGICRGVNAGYDLLYEDGSSATTGSGTIMYTCNGSNYHDITLTFWS